MDVEEIFEGDPRGRLQRNYDDAKKVADAALAYVKALDAVWAASVQLWRARMEDLQRARKRLDRLVREYGKLPEPHPMRGLDGPVEL